MAATAINLRQLGTLMEKVAIAVVQDVTEYEIELVAHTVAELARNTPVDVGTARSNWIVTIGMETEALRSAFSPFLSRHKGGPGGTLAETRNQAGVTWSAAAVLKSNKDAQDIYISNNLPYIQRLNEGWSTQAPAGFIEAAVLVGQARVEELFRFTNIEKLF